MRRVILLSVLVAACDVGEVKTGNGATDGAPADMAGGAGSLQVTATASPTAGGGGQYNPLNIVAIWVEGPTGTTFVKTIGRWANTRKQHLVAWNLAAGAGDADAVSGATRNTYADPLTLTWNLTDRQNQVIPDGTYTIRMESTDLNATQATQNNQGTFTFIKGPSPQMQTALSNGGFSNVSIAFTP